MTEKMFGLQEDGQVFIDFDWLLNLTSAEFVQEIELGYRLNKCVNIDVYEHSNIVYVYLIGEDMLRRYVYKKHFNEISCAIYGKWELELITEKFGGEIKWSNN